MPLHRIFRHALKILLWLFPIYLILVGPASATSSREEESGERYGIKCITLGGTVGRVEGLSRSLGELAGPDNKAIILEALASDYPTPFTSVDYQLSLFLVNDFNLVQGALGLRYSTVPFPKAFIRPWVAGYVTLNLIEDLRVREYLYDPGINAYVNEADGIGVGLAAAVGVTMRLSRSFALEAAFRVDGILTAGWLDTGDFFDDEFAVRATYLRILYFLNH